MAEIWVSGGGRKLGCLRKRAFVCEEIWGLIGHNRDIHEHLQHGVWEPRSVHSSSKEDRAVGTDLEGALDPFLLSLCHAN